jgi:hypothetical protein
METAIFRSPALRPVMIQTVVVIEMDRAIQGNMPLREPLG